MVRKRRSSVSGVVSGEGQSFSVPPNGEPLRPPSSDLCQATPLSYDPYQSSHSTSKVSFWSPKKSLGGDSSSSQAPHLSSRNVEKQFSGLSSDLHQANPLQHQPPYQSPRSTSSKVPFWRSKISLEGDTSSSQAPHLSSTHVTEQFSGLSLDHESSPSQKLVTSSSMDMKFPRRPGTGSLGTKCSVTANHFSLKLPDIDLCQYDVTITPKDASGKIITSQGVNRAVMNTLVNLHRQTDLQNKLPGYDGRKNLFTAGPLTFDLKVFEIALVEEYDSIQGAVARKREFTVKIKLVAHVDLHNAPQETLMALDIVLRERPTSKYVRFGRSFYSLDFGKEQHLDRGLDCWQGFFLSIRPTQMGFSLNADVSYTAIIKPIPVIDYVTQLLERRFISSQPLSDADHVKIKKGLIGIKVEVTHQGETRRKYRISGLTTQTTRELTFPDDKSGTLKYVVEYFRETYGLSLKHTQLPCLQMGNELKPIYLPMEVCKIVPGQTYSKRLNKEQITALLKVTSKPPQERKTNIYNTLLQNDYANDECAQGFGIEINPVMAQFDARVLPAPELEYNNSGQIRYWQPRGGVWNMNDKKMFNGEKVNHWICVNFVSNVEDTTVLEFCQALANVCSIHGMTFSSEPVMPPVRAYPNRLESVLKTSFRKAMTLLQGKELDLLIVVLPDKKGSLYGDLKRICDTDLGIVSQCCLAKHVYERKYQYLVNVSLKINVKVGGRNTVLARRMPIVSDRSTIIFGADVTHPNPGDFSSPSIAAVVASQDWPEIAKYASLVSAQAHRQEIIQDLFTSYEDPKRGIVTGGMIKDLLISFRTANGGNLPESIIFYRDGVSEGQFNQVLLSEVCAIRRACASIEPNYQPPITFVVVQKRHHTRLFPNDRNSDKSGNILPGTVVDTTICHPTQFDFYLCSHAGIKGTSRPAHYHVLWDENNFSADALQTVTYNLCYTYARCTRAVSIAPPVYYAHLAAFRARCYIEPETSGGGGDGGRAVRAPPGANVNVTPLPALKEKVKRGMFFC